MARPYDPCKANGHDVVRVGACILDSLDQKRGTSWDECMTCNPDRAEEIGYKYPDKEKVKE